MGVQVPDSGSDALLVLEDAGQRGPFLRDRRVGVAPGGVLDDGVNAPLKDALAAGTVVRAEARVHKPVPGW